MFPLPAPDVSFSIILLRHNPLGAAGCSSVSQILLNFLSELPMQPTATLFLADCPVTQPETAESVGFF
jgi:hypothetical protein